MAALGNAPKTRRPEASTEGGMLPAGALGVARGPRRTVALLAVLTLVVSLLPVGIAGPMLAVASAEDLDDFPSTNDQNRLDGSGHFVVTNRTSNSITLEFKDAQPTDFFEIRIDGEEAPGEGELEGPKHVTGSGPSDEADPGLGQLLNPCRVGFTDLPPACNSKTYLPENEPQYYRHSHFTDNGEDNPRTFSVNSFLEVRLALGPSRSDDFDWTRVNVLPTAAPTPDVPEPPVRIPAPEVPAVPVEPEVPAGSTIERGRGEAGAIVDGAEVETIYTAPDVDPADPDVPPPAAEVERRRTVTRDFVDEVLAGVPAAQRGVVVEDTDEGAAIVGLLADRADPTVNRPVPPSAVAAVTAGDVRLLAVVTDRVGNPRDRAADGTLRATAGGDAAVRGFGLPPNSEGQVQLRSTARVLGVIEADGTGRLASQVEIPGDVPPGEHTLVVTVGGATISIGITVEVEFPDVSADNVHLDAIETLAADGVFQGRADGTFGPQAGLVRGQMATVLTRLLDLEVDPDAVAPFDDVAEDATHGPAIAAIAASGLTDGCAERRFCPDTVVTRAQLAAFLARGYDLPASDDDPFSDIASATLAAEIRAAAAAGVVQGFGDNTFRPNEPVTRAQAASMLLSAREAAGE